MCHMMQVKCYESTLIVLHFLPGDKFEGPDLPMAVFLGGHFYTDI